MLKWILFFIFLNTCYKTRIFFSSRCCFPERENYEIAVGVDDREKGRNHPSCLFSSLASPRVHDRRRVSLGSRFFSFSFVLLLLLLSGLFFLFFSFQTVVAIHGASNPSSREVDSCRNESPPLSLPSMSTFDQTKGGQKPPVVFFSSRCGSEKKEKPVKFLVFYSFWFWFLVTTCRSSSGTRRCRRDPGVS